MLKQQSPVLQPSGTPKVRVRVQVVPKIPLRASTRRIIFRIHVSRRSLVPASIRKRNLSIDERIERSGEAQVIKTTRNVSVNGLVGDMEKLGFRMVDALWRDTNELSLISHPVVRVVFARNEDVYEAVDSSKEEIRVQLLELMQTAHWEVGCFYGPFRRGHVLIPEAGIANIVLAKRAEIIDGSGRQANLPSPSRLEVCGAESIMLLPPSED